TALLPNLEHIRTKTAHKPTPHPKRYPNKTDRRINPTTQKEYRKPLEARNSGNANVGNAVAVRQPARKGRDQHRPAARTTYIETVGGVSVISHISLAGSCRKDGARITAASDPSAADQVL
ncbi:MAG: hypothetical protein ACSHW1_18190, partial [Yoonia sp.]|uniref:hypothetical protein n=1 Tax=Yoonia sp. TaxID=2212373 RepID=UPI003EF334F1